MPGDDGSPLAEADDWDGRESITARTASTRESTRRSVVDDIVRWWWWEERSLRWCRSAWWDEDGWAMFLTLSECDGDREVDVVARRIDVMKGEDDGRRKGEEDKGFREQC
jgi:hypothetical protein